MMGLSREAEKIYKNLKNPCGVEGYKISTISNYNNIPMGRIRKPLKELEDKKLIVIENEKVKIIR